jgi:Virulence protein RhuM family
LIRERADAGRENMGLVTWPNDNIRKQDVTVAKNYLAEAEVRELNRLTTILLDIFEDQLDLRRLVAMEDAGRLLDSQLQSLGRSVLRRWRRPRSRPNTLTKHSMLHAKRHGATSPTMRSRSWRRRIGRWDAARERRSCD